MAWRKMDSDVGADDAATHSFVPLRMRANLAAIGSTRHMGATRGFHAAASTDYLPEISTHPDYWLSIPILIPTERNAATLNLVVSATGNSSGDTMNFRAAVNGLTGTATTLSSSTQTTTSPSVAYEAPTGGWTIAALQVKSDVGSSAGTVQIIDTRANAFLVDETTGGGDVLGSVTYPDGRAHFLLDIDSWHSSAGNTDTLRRRYYVGRVEAGGVAPVTDMLYMWPSPPARTLIYDTAGGAKTDATFYDVASYTIHSIGWYYSGQRGGFPGAGGMYSGEPIRGADVRALSRQCEKMYRERRYVIGFGPVQTSEGLTGSIVLNSATTVLNSGFVLREDVTGVDLAFWGMGLGTRSDSSEITATMTVGEYGGTSRSVTQTITLPVTEPTYDPGRGGSMTQTGLAQVRGEWGMWDLGFPGEHVNGAGYGALVEMSCGLPSGAAAGDPMYVSLSINGDHVYVGAVTAVERIHGRGL